jgi:hypothetical protein
MNPSVTYEPISMEHWWNDTDKGKLTCSEENLAQCTCFVQRDLLHREYLQRVQEQITKLFPLTNFNKYLHYGTSGTEVCVCVCVYICVYIYTYVYKV